MPSERNPLDLPELRSLIFEYLSDSDLAACARVCGAWEEQATDLLWSEVYFPYCFINLFNIDDRKRLERYGNKVETLNWLEEDMKEAQRLPDQALELLSSIPFRRLVRIEIQSISRSHLIIDPALRHMQIYHLRGLSIHGNPLESTVILSTLLAHCSELKTLELSFTKDEFMRAYCVIDIIKRARNLELLCLVFPGRTAYPMGLSREILSLPKLRSIALGCIRDRDLIGAANDLDFPLPSLKCLAPACSAAVAKKLIEVLPQIESLNLKLKDYSVNLLSSFALSLRLEFIQIEASWGLAISATDVKTLFGSCTALRMFHLYSANDSCADIVADALAGLGYKLPNLAALTLISDSVEVEKPETLVSIAKHCPSLAVLQLGGRLDFVQLAALFPKGSACLFPSLLDLSLGEGGQIQDRYDIELLLPQPDELLDFLGRLCPKLTVFPFPPEPARYHEMFGEETCLFLEPPEWLDDSLCCLYYPTWAYEGEEVEWDEGV